MEKLDMSQNKKMELVCPAGSLPALKVAVDNGADCVYMGFRDNTNARNFAGSTLIWQMQRKVCAMRITMEQRYCSRSTPIPNHPARRSGRPPSTTPPISASTR